MRAVQKENIINEWKGNLFEYLVAEALARHYDFLDPFYWSLPEATTNFLSEYQHKLLAADRDVYAQLPLWAEQVVMEMKKHLPLVPERIMTTGKFSTHKLPMDKGEADLILCGKKGTDPQHEELCFVSLKLCRAQSYVNTKNAGEKSFFEKYFGPFWNEEKQRIYQQEIDQAYLQFGHALYEEVQKGGREVDLLDEEEALFAGSFDQKWKEWDQADLPGELTSAQREILFSWYHHVITLVYNRMREFLRTDRPLFEQCLLALMGREKNDIWQVLAFHGGPMMKKGPLQRLLVLEQGFYEKNLSTFKLLPPEKNRSSFSLHFDDFILQIRAKPMNKFTAPALKINCSLKFH